MDNKDLINNSTNDSEDYYYNFDENDDETSMSPSEKPNKNQDFTRGDLIRRIVMLVSLVVFLVCAALLVNIFFKYKAGREIYSSVSSEILKPNPNKGDGSTNDGTQFIYDHNALTNMNSDAVGYLVIPSIKLQLPIVQGDDNSYYLNHAINGKESMFGTLFIDAAITEGLQSSNVIIYGHNMYDGSMFAGLAKYKDPDFFNNNDNTLVYVYSKDTCYTYRLFSIYETTPISDTYRINFKSISALRVYASEMKAKSINSSITPIDNADQLLTFSTCTNRNDGRLVAHCVLTGSKKISE